MMDIVCPYCHRQLQCNSWSWRKLAIVLPLAVVFALLCGAAFNALKNKVGQHPEDANSPVVLAEEKQLLDDYCETHGNREIQVMLDRAWPKYREWSRRSRVPWSCFMSRESQIYARVRRMEEMFRAAEEDVNWMIDLDDRKREFNKPSVPWTLD